jgi:tetratricopeptide (TPR) repeat protein
MRAAAARAHARGSLTESLSLQPAPAGTDGDVRGGDAGSWLAAEVDRVRQLLAAGEYSRALVAGEALLARAPRSRDVLYMVAVSQRHLHRIPEALATLARLESWHPRFTRLFQERGQCQVALRSAEAAIEAFERAVQLCPALPASWQALQGLYRLGGRTADCANAAAQVVRLASLPREVVTATVLFADGDLYEAEHVIRRFLLAQPDHVEGMRLLARIGMELDVLDDAELLLESLLVLAPDYHAARYDYAITLLRRHKHVRALQEIARLRALEPKNRVYRTTGAAVAMGLGQYGRALALYQELQGEDPRDPELQLSVAHALKTLGRTSDAVVAYRAAAAVKADYGEAYWSLANLKTYRFTDGELARMRGAEAAPAVGLADRYHLCFAIGKGLEDRGEYAESFDYYRRGNELKDSELRYRPEVIETNARMQSSVCTREFFAARAGSGCPSAAPIFIVGLPRSGSTLLEQILASHTQVEGTTELADVPRMVQELQGREHNDIQPRYPGVLAELQAKDFARLGEQYLADTLIYRTGGRPFFIDKNPNNFRHLGLIQLILPNARIIDARRRPMACCFGNYKQLFAVGQRFTYSLEHIAHYYRCYVQLMSHWEAVLSGRILRVQYEDVVHDLEGNVRRILGFCGLEFEPACLRFHETERSVNTASSEQVRQPIYREGLEQWRNFEPWLGPLRAALGTLAEP